MSQQFPLTVTSLGKEIFKGTADMVVLPGETGIFDVLAEHENTFEFLKKGEIKIVSGDDESIIGITEGFALIARNENNEFTVSVIVDHEIQPMYLERNAVRREVER